MEARKPLAEHVAAYVAHCTHAGQALHHVKQKRTQLAAMLKGSKAARLSELTPDALELHLTALQYRKLSARSVNFARQIAVAFCAWCVKTGRLEVNALRVVPKQDESRDRRRVRRALTDEELARLLEVARERGREAWYLAALLAGLRKGDLRRLTWADVDFVGASLRVCQGKAKREDTLPMHSQLAAALQALQDERRALPSARVWPTVVTDRTRAMDFQRAGIEAVDDQGRVVDLHAMRTTLGTQLARAGVAPQVAMLMLRHSDHKTTMKHYTALGIQDAAAAIARLPTIAAVQPAALAATGTGDAVGGVAQSDTTKGAKRCEMVRRSALERCDGARRGTNKKTLQGQGICADSAGKEARRVKGFEPSTFSLGS
ncbi:MAG: site-specific integrase [Planctomycetes bacterium]|nr:site-specific integrase [Planctomycetota bacterium]